MKGWRHKLKSDRASRLEVLHSTLILYWIVLLLSMVMNFLFMEHLFEGVSGLFSIYIIMLIFMLMMHFSVLIITYIDGVHWMVRDLWIWIVIVLFTGPIGFTIYYFRQKGKNHYLNKG
ncbi:MAG TPA: hypothetical protein EYP23_00975 [Thermoplasmata archaeon]|nr:hypothetical protein [Thermoplasmata archaeon]